MQKIFVVEDNEDIRQIVTYALNYSGFDAHGFESAEQLYKALNESIPALVILDIMLPQKDGLTILEELRKDVKTRKLPIIMLTAKSSEHDKIKGLDMGADDYIAKPFGVMELISRVNALLRRVSNDQPEKLEFSGLTLFPARREVRCDGTIVKLTFKEFELLYYLMLNLGQVFSRTQLLEKIWGFDIGSEGRTVDMHIKFLRHKLGKKSGMIKTIRSVGYMLSD